MGCSISSYLVANFGFLLTYGARTGSSGLRCAEVLFLAEVAALKVGSSLSLFHAAAGEGGSDNGEAGGGDEHVDDDDDVIDSAGERANEDSSEKLRDLSNK
jgi:hypothetical protein